jgi:hypothetical protein
MIVIGYRYGYGLKAVGTDLESGLAWSGGCASTEISRRTQRGM